MLVIISGPSCVGKSFCINRLTANYNFKNLMPYTTRAPRPAEYEGVHYHFMIPSALRQISDNFQSGYWIKPLNDGEWYGYTRDLDKLPDDFDNWIIHTDADMAVDIKEKHRQTTIIFLDYANEHTFEERLTERFKNDTNQINIRKDHANKQRTYKLNFDYILTSDNPNDLFEQLYGIVSKLVVQPIQSQQLYPGTLSDIDIWKLLEDPHGIKVEGLTKEELQRQVHGWTLNLSLGTKYYRVPRKRFDFKIFDFAYSNEKDMATRFEEYVANPEEGIFLKPGEFILATTVERISLPANIVGLVSGRSSYARVGINVEFSQNVLQSEHHDSIPLQIKNNLPYPVRIYPFSGIAQVVFFKTTSSATKPYHEQNNYKYKKGSLDIRSRIYDDPVHEKVRKVREKGLKWHTKITIPRSMKFIFGVLVIILGFVVVFLSLWQSK